MTTFTLSSQDWELVGTFFVLASFTFGFLIFGGR